MSALLLRPLAFLLTCCLIASGAAVLLGSRAGDDVVALWAMMDFGADYEIYLVDARTQIAHNLSRSPELDAALAWSPDGRRLAYARRQEQRYAVRVVDARGRELSQMAVDFAPVALIWSPDGSQIAALSASNDIYLGEVATGIWRSLIRSLDLAENHISWSPDGTRLAYTVNSNSIWVITPATGERRRLAEISRYSVPRWSPDGTRIAYTRWNGDVSAVEVADGRVTLLSAAQQPRTGLLWSEDSVQVVFVAQRTDGLALRTINTRTGDLADVVLPFAKISSLAWSPDERAVVVSAAETPWAARESLYAVDRATGSSLRLTDDSIFVRYALWQPAPRTP